LLPIEIAEILRQESGQFDRRFRIDPIEWPHFDLLWIHAGKVSLAISGAQEMLDLIAPMGVLLYPGTRFEGRSLSAHADASICHFRLRGTWLPGHRLPPAEDAFALQAMVAVSLKLARQKADPARRLRLLHAIVDGFEAPQGGMEPENRVDRAWRLAAERLDRIRGLSDVASRAGLSESAFRAEHRAQHGTSAGVVLTSLRLAAAERLLATTALTQSDIAAAVGYGHAETLSHAFRRSRGLSPGAWRRTQRPFA